MQLEQGPSGRVVITGIGAVTPLGIGIENFWPRLLKGESGAGKISLFDTSEYSTRIAAEVKDFNAEDWLDRKEARRVDRFLAFAEAASQMALEDARFPVEQCRNETGVLIGSGIGGLTFLSEQLQKLFSQGPSRVSPFLVPYMIPDMASGYVSINHRLGGPNTCVVNACATGTNAIGDAYHIVKRGDAVAMLAGGTEAPLNPAGLGGFCAARAMTMRNDDPKRASRPFDRDRDGFLIAEGSAVLVLEDYAHAKARNAQIYGEIAGYGMSGDGYHLTKPDPESKGQVRAMQMAFRNACLAPKDIDYINAHGTGTPYNDVSETQAIKQVFGDHAYNTPISSSKSMIGHMLGAGGAIEALICLLALRDGIAPPTINLDTPDPACDLDYIPNEARKMDMSIVMSNSFGFGGHNATIILKKCCE